MKGRFLIAGAFLILAGGMLPWLLSTPATVASISPTPAPPAVKIVAAAKAIARENAAPLARPRSADDSLESRTARDAPGTARAVLAIKDEDARKVSMLRVMKAWGDFDAKAALAWVKAAPFENAYERHVASCMACTQFARSDPEEAICLAIDYNLDPEDFGLLEGLTSTWAQDDPDAASDWVLRQPAGVLRDRLVESVAVEMFDEDPATASEFVQQHISVGESRDQAVLALLVQTASTSPDAALQWALSFPSGRLRDRAVIFANGFRNRQRDVMAGNR